jgi:ABC-2 type transport system permease protein
MSPALRWTPPAAVTGGLTAGLEIQASTGLNHLPIGPWAALGVLAAWATAGLLAGGLLLRLRDA